MKSLIIYGFGIWGLMKLYDTFVAPQIRAAELRDKLNPQDKLNSSNTSKILQTAKPLEAAKPHYV